jgi:hypothetical protein
VQVHCIGTAGFGLVLGYLVKVSARVGRIRNHRVPAGIGFVSGLVGLYSAWGADMLARRWVPPNVPFWAAFDPRALTFYIPWFYENGMWSWGEHAQGPMTGPTLAFIWLCEAVTIVGLATALPWNEIRDWVFCENCGWWETIESNLNNFSADRADVISERLNAGDLSVLRDLPLAQPADLAFLRLHLARCETCDESNYLDLEQVTITFDKQGAPKPKSKFLVRKLQLAAADVPLVTEAGAVAASAAESAPAIGTEEGQAAAEGTDSGELTA